ncbi:serine hydrolase domain-containing protein [Spirilliplanes yamanashiensis]|uniref:Serine hydrolase n=1 Tax=Spirilliplanes yamanashiensis TaxID=42233 RepID=A0A8J4DLI3_9ACTN|nr:serine hydrolase domain-containing protein [Spirilliplanes yamanashiensis]MDP9818659.1 D-alanyl-D-alanine carboxypeptidase [Spirilliplanes yamanashiensis]GIJ05115.1 serine hydrolase [Spirilliplanes yamanashiensis]
MLRRLLSGLTALAVTTGLLTVAAPAGAAPPVDDTRARLQALLDAEVAAGMPGVVAEVRDGRRTHRLASGLADPLAGRPAKPDMRHRAGSITKTFVATVVLQLAAERRLRLDAPAGRYLRDVPPGVTVRMLLNHTSGIGNYTDALLATPEAIIDNADTEFRPRQLARIGLGLPATGAPGERYSYSNTNYVLLGLIVERLTGRPFEAEVARRILRPLGLRDTYVQGAEERLRGPHMGAYAPYEGGLYDFSAYNGTWAWAAGALISTPSDLNRFYRALLGGRLLPSAQLAEMRRTVVQDPAYPDAGGYGLGLYFVQLPCGRVWGHDGGTIGHAMISWHREDGTRQLTLSENMRFYSLPGEAHPIDEARAAFLITALCGDAPAAATRSAGGPLPGPVTPDVARF